MVVGLVETMVVGLGGARVAASVEAMVVGKVVTMGVR
jgi:hypothetical protein